MHDQDETQSTAEAEAEVRAGTKEKRIAVVEIFGPTIQGEGPLAGTKTMFIRFGGCDYRCSKCDSLHAVIPQAVKKHARYLTAEEIADEIVPVAKQTGTIWVTLSGGNPCMWDLSKLIALLQGSGLGIALETQGTLAPDWIARCQMVVVSPKSPGMGEKFEEGKFRAFLCVLDHWHQKWKKKGVAVNMAVKVVIFSAQDLEFAKYVDSVWKNSAPELWSPQLFLSLGNPYPPRLNDQNELEDLVHSRDTHIAVLLRDYRVLVEEVVADPSLTHVKVLPQLHVLTYGNEAGR